MAFAIDCEASVRRVAAGLFGNRERASRTGRLAPESVIPEIAVPTVESFATDHADSFDIFSDSGQRNRSRGPCAVCIDDDADFIAILTRHLGEIGVTAIGATNAITGMRAINCKQPDMVFTDYFMPSELGMYVLRRLQQDRCARQIPVIVVTGCDIRARIDASHNTTVAQQLSKLGAASILRKPVHRDALASAVSRCLEPSFAMPDDESD